MSEKAVRFDLRMLEDLAAKNADSTMLYHVGKHLAQSTA